MHIHYWEVPSQQALVWPTIQALSATKRPATINEIVAYFKENFSDAERLFSVFYEKRPNVSVFRDRISRSCRTAEKLGFTKRVRRGAYDLSPQGEALFYLSETSAEECVREAIHTLHPNTAIMSRQTSSLQGAKTLQREVGEVLHNQKSIWIRRCKVWAQSLLIYRKCQGLVCLLFSLERATRLLRFVRTLLPS